MQTPTFIISFDCEGKWGMADHISDHHCCLLTNERLNTVYQQLIDLLEKWNIKATFAFVGAFTMSIEEYQMHKEWFIDVPIDGRNWLSRFRGDVACNRFDGWFNPTAFEIVRKASRHEMASHGFTHLPLNEQLIAKQDFLNEMELSQKVFHLKNQSVKTLVYPKNLIGYTSLLRSFGIVGYRGSLYTAPGKLTPVKNLLSELNIKQIAQTPEKPRDGLVKIPSGYFLNWRAHLRKGVPISITLNRWFHAIRDAIAHNRVIHLRTHPHNFIDGDQQFVLLEQILKFVSEKQKRQEILNLSQRDYCHRMLSLG